MFRLICNNLYTSFRCILVFFFWGVSGCFCVAVGQGNLIDYNNSAKSLFFNPAMNSPKGQYVISILPLATTDFDLSMPVSMSDIFEKQNDSANYSLNLSRLTKRVGRINQLTFNSTISYLNYSFKTPSANLGFQVYENIYTAFSFEKNLVEFLDNGNFAYINQNFSTHLPLSFSHFTTWQLSYSKKIKDKFRIGFSAKIYFGKSTVSSNTEFSLFTDSLINYIDIGLSGKVKASAPLLRSVNNSGNLNGINLMPGASLSDYIFNFKNPGLGVDIGFQYHFSKKIDFSASVIDLGFISWLSNINSVDISGTYRWDGIDLNRFIKVPTDTSFMNNLEKMNLIDSIFYSAMSPSNNTFITLAPLKVYLSANYLYNDKLTFSAINRLSLFDTFLSESFLLSGTYSFNKNWNIYSGLSISNRSYFDIPLGFSFINNRFHFSMSVSNVWGLIVPSYSKSFGGSLSAVLILDGYSRAEKEEMILYPFYRRYKKWLND
jgi:hypothetical protein